MFTDLHWVSGPWRGKLALAARPRGGDWLEDEIAAWSRAGIGTVCSFLTSAEEHELGLTAEASQAQAHGMNFLSLPIPDRHVPASDSRFSLRLDQLSDELTRGESVVLHCRQGIGRTGLVAACLLIGQGVDKEIAVARLSTARGIPVPETEEQREWISRYAESLATAQ